MDRAKLTADEQTIYDRHVQNNDDPLTIKYRSRGDVKYFLECYGIEEYTIYRDLKVDVDASVNLNEVFPRSLTKLPIQFDVVNGHFDVSKNGLTTLEGCPRIVKGNFDASSNYLRSLKHFPQEISSSVNLCFNKVLASLDGIPPGTIIHGNFSCAYSDLTSLKGSPQFIKGDFFCNNNHLETLEGGPERVDGSFDCSYNNIVNLIGAPKEVGENFDCSNTYSRKATPGLASLEGSPERIKGNFNCFASHLTTLVGGPKHVNGNFVCVSNLLDNLHGAPKYVGGNMDCSANKLQTLNGFKYVEHKFSIEKNPDLSLVEIAQFKHQTNTELGRCDYKHDEIQKAVETIALHEAMNKAVKQKDDLPMARAISNTQMSATQTGKRKI
ncbi:hypothetical protein [Burkholderia cenocepacia]|uniref:Pentapeptide repeat-containing protein n=1 Tax=Burkholderia cenocepacia TaxID=95486 RepID=A0ABD4UDB1_9BURK|nr:hypothetical protein [Burkholderia cenocepacia]MCW3696286.1 hypothetical protein [Burkholderia cenocepacia]MCW3704495.1 hypothetical protein [Burkholderia cenocepacia]MCW3712066.1 hypothetical protein [Burkholderia cenocepacia]MCW3720065.1 hypothetical protein [Burkholderia cenocepacia]MCW3727871.1 hypothetical protein [Burkholderia cenocepacia]